MSTWYCRGQSHPWRSAAACCLWWHHGSWLLSRWQRRGRASIWSPTLTGPGLGKNLDIYCTPAEGHSTFAAGRCSLCNPAEMTSSFAYFVVHWLGLWEKTCTTSLILVFNILYPPYDEVNRTIALVTWRLHDYSNAQKMHLS